MDSTSDPRLPLLEGISGDIARDVQRAQDECAQITAELCDVSGPYAFIAVERLADRASLASGRLRMSQFLLEQRMLNLLDQATQEDERSVLGRWFEVWTNEIVAGMRTVASAKDLAAMMSRLLEHENDSFPGA